MTSTCANLMGILLMVLPVLSFQYLSNNNLSFLDDLVGSDGDGTTKEDTTIIVPNNNDYDDIDKEEENQGGNVSFSSILQQQQHYQLLCLVLGGIGGILYSQTNERRPYGFIWCAGMFGGAIFSITAFLVTQAAFQYNEEAFIENPSSVTILSFLVATVPSYMIYAMIKRCSDYTFPHSYQTIPNHSSNVTTTFTSSSSSSSANTRKTTITTTPKTTRPQSTKSRTSNTSGGPSYETLSQMM